MSAELVSAIGRCADRLIRYRLITVRASRNWFTTASEFRAPHSVRAIIGAVRSNGYCIPAIASEISEQTYLKVIRQVRSKANLNPIGPTYLCPPVQRPSSLQNRSSPYLTRVPGNGSLLSAKSSRVAKPPIGDCDGHLRIRGNADAVRVNHKETGEFITLNRRVSLFGQLLRSRNHTSPVRRLRARKPTRKLRQKPSERDRYFASDPFTNAIILIDRAGRIVSIDVSQRKNFTRIYARFETRKWFRETYNDCYIRTYNVKIPKKCRTRFFDFRS